MKYRVEFSERARRNLFEIGDWIARDSIEHATAWIEHLESRAQSLCSHPQRCPVVNLNESPSNVIVRRLVVGDYLVLFTIEGNRVLVLEMRHGSREGGRSDE